MPFIIIKHGQTKHNIEIDANTTVLTLKTQIYTLTNVHPERQKLVKAGKQIHDNDDLSSLKPNQLIMLLGTADDLPKVPEKTLFVEDMSAQQLANVLKVPSGLVNLGNTCYMAACIQCLRSIPELQVALKKANLNAVSDPQSSLVVSLRDLFRMLDNTADPVQPFAFVHLMRATLPRFNESGHHGFVQQDAEEFWGELTSILKLKVPGLDGSYNISNTEHFVDQFITGQMTISLKCNESVDEAPTTTVENFLKLTVNIGAGVSTYMATDIQAGLTQQVEKNSISLNRNSIYTQVSRVSRLPYYLVVNFVRFQWKSSENIRAKILKRVKFPHDLDVYDFCTPELQEKLKVGRNRVKQLDDINAELKKTKVDPNESAAAKPEYTTHDERAVEYQKLGIDSSLIGDVGCNVSGWYDLVAVLTHVGRTADSGHYVGWVKNQEGWFKYDDEKVSQCSVEDIAKLEGGGDWHSAYICLYKAKDLK